MQSFAATMRARATRTAPKFLDLDLDWVFGFDDLGGRVHHIRQMDPNDRRAAAVNACTLATTMGFVQSRPGAVCAFASDGTNSGWDYSG